MKIQYCSDLHLEFEQNSSYLLDRPLKVSGDILICAGDIVPLHDEFFTNSFFSFIASHYKQVFWVPGNHEFYYKDISLYSNSYNLKVGDNINIVNNIALQYEDIQFAFSTMWSKISTVNEKRIEQSVSDFECITYKKRKLNAKDFNTLHDFSLRFIKQSLENTNGKTLVVSHYVPSRLCNAPLHNNSSINEAFCVDLTDYIKGCNANFWIYGHSHYNQKPLYIGNTILLTNQLGYVQRNEHEKFMHNAYFSI